MSRSPFGPAADGPPPDPFGRFVCPVCGARSNSREAKAFGYCGRCHDYTGLPAAFMTPAAGDDPREAPGAVVGPGGAYDRNAVIVDMRHALIVQEVQCAPVRMHGRSRSTGRAEVVENYLIEMRGTRAAEGGDGVHLRLDPENVGVLVLLANADGIAAIITETMAVLARHERALHDAYFQMVAERLKELEAAEQDGQDGAGHIRERSAAADPGPALHFHSMNITVLTSGDPAEDQVPPVAWEFAGRVNRTDDHVTTVAVGAGKAVVEMLAPLMLAGFRDPEVDAAFRERLDALRDDGSYPGLKR
jgi:hypothetical protein